jgi:3-hydroxybutyrate dehydrogenase
MTYENLQTSAGIKGKCALVTGSTQGMGLATARALAAQGCNVMIHGLASPGDGEAIRAKISEEFAVKTSFSGAELAELAGIEALFKQTERDIGPVEILVNNAAARNLYKFEDIPTARWDYAVAVNLTAPFHLIRLALPGMKSRRWGRIVNIASNLGLVGTVNRADYIATKHGLVGLTRAVALEALPFHITANAICPGSTLTPHAERQLRERMEQGKMSREEAEKQFLLTKQPSRRFVLPQQIADLVVFLCSPAASEMTGSPISMDGGWMAE